MTDAPTRYHDLELLFKTGERQSLSYQTPRDTFTEYADRVVVLVRHSEALTEEHVINMAELAYSRTTVSTATGTTPEGERNNRSTATAWS